jgi:ABC-type polysaccharide/polyol phosphate export permease
MPQPGEATLRESWAIQRRVIGALLMREVLTRYGRHNIGFLWLFVEPMLFTLGVAALWTATRSIHGSSLPIVAFALTGYSSVLLWRNMPSRCVNGLAPSFALMYHRNVRAMDIYAARLLIEAIGATCSFVVLSILFIGIEWMSPPEDLLTVVGGWLLLGWFGASLALFIGTLSELSEAIDKLWHPAAYLLFPLSGAAFSVDALPPSAREFMLWVPMVNGVEMVRGGYFGSQYRAHYDVGYVALVCAMLSIGALALLRIVARRIVPND